MENIAVPFLSRLAGQAPVLIVYLVGMILALVFWKRWPVPCLLTLIATILLLVTAVAVTYLDLHFFRARYEEGWDDTRYASTMFTLNLGATGVRAVATGLLLGAVFTGRPRPLPSVLPAPRARSQGAEDETRFTA